MPRAPSPARLVRVLNETLSRLGEPPASPGGANSPVMLFWITSGIPPTRVATLGQAKHIASRIPRQKLSISDV